MSDRPKRTEVELEDAARMFGENLTRAARLVEDLAREELSPADALITLSFALGEGIRRIMPPEKHVEAIARSMEMVEMGRAIMQQVAEEPDDEEPAER